MAAASLVLPAKDVPMPPASSPLLDVPCSPEIQVLLAVHKGGGAATSLPFRVLSRDTIASVKLRIARATGYYIGQQKLICSGRELSRERAELGDYKINSGDVLHLVLRLSDLVDVRVATADGGSYVINVASGSRVFDLKQRIKSKEGSHVGALVVRGKCLADEQLVGEVLEEEDTVYVHLLVPRTEPVRIRPISNNELELSISNHRLQERAPQFESGPAGPEAGGGSAPCLSLAAIPKSDKPDSRGGQHAVDSSEATLESLEAGAMSSSVLKMIARAKAGLEAGHVPSLSAAGMGGAYFFQDGDGVQTVAVFKPSESEPGCAGNPRGLCSSSSGYGLKRGCLAGEGCFKEVAAYLLAPEVVPPTSLVACSHESLYVGQEDGLKEPKLGSLQEFVPATSNCEDMGPSLFPVREVHKITILDIRMANTDRSGENILCVDGGDGEALKLVPIDHGYCLPDQFEDVWFDWLYWPQARVPFGEDARAYVEALDADRDIAMLEAKGVPLRPLCTRTLRVSTLLLKKAVGLDLTAYQIGSIMCRTSGVDLPSHLECLLDEAGRLAWPQGDDDLTLLGALSGLLDRELPIYKEQIV